LETNLNKESVMIEPILQEATEVPADDIVKEFIIPTCHMEELSARFEKLNKKARKLGCALPSFRIVETFERTYTRHPLTDAPFLSPLVVHYTRIIVEGDVLKYAGWSFIATIEHHPEGNLVKAVPGFELDPSYRSMSATCDHCHSARNRKNTYVVRHDDGTEKRVGSTCVGDFLGHDSPERVASHLELFFRLFNELSDSEGWSERIVYRYPIEHLLQVTACVISVYGWVSRASVENDHTKTPTSSDVMMYLNDDSLAAIKLRREHPITEEHKETAAKALAWVLSLTDLSNDYLYNIQTVAKMESIELKNFGLAVSIISAYQREVEQRNVERARREQRGASEWIGEVGDKFETEAVCTIVKDVDSTFGVTYLCKFIADGKNFITWFASSAPSFDEGDTVRFKGRIKALDEYKGSKQTLVTRCKVMEIQKAATEES
jgi:hypothetical protein